MCCGSRDLLSRRPPWRTARGRCVREACEVGSVGSSPFGFQMQPQVAVPVGQPVTYDKDKFARLRELKQLLDGGVLSQEEFDTQKKAILAGGHV